MDQNRNSRKVLQGVVSSAAGQKTISVAVERAFAHPKYKKIIRRHKKVHAHDEAGDANVGDLVEVMECRPLSKTKRFRLTRVVRRAAFAGGEIAGGEQ